jgi:hypothetical protein
VPRAGQALGTLPAPCSAPEYRQFDFWVGDWTVVDTSGTPAGTNRVTHEFGGCVVQEHWAGTDGSRGTSLNTYDASTKRWHQTWVDNNGAILLLEGGVADGKMVLMGETVGARTGKAYLNRITWQREGSPNKVRQVWDMSTDGGATWKNLFNGLYSRQR